MQWKESLQSVSTLRWTTAMLETFLRWKTTDQRKAESSRFIPPLPVGVGGGIQHSAHLLPWKAKFDPQNDDIICNFSRSGDIVGHVLIACVEANQRHRARIPSGVSSQTDHVLLMSCVEQIFELHSCLCHWAHPRELGSCSASSALGMKLSAVPQDHVMRKKCSLWSIPLVRNTWKCLL